MRAVRRRKNQRGNVLVEFTVSVLVLTMLLAATADLGRMFYYADLCASAAEAGVHYAMVSAGHNTDLTGIQNAALAEPNTTPTLTGLSAVATNFYTCEGSTTTSTTVPSCGSGKVVTYVQVNVTYSFKTLMGWTFIPNTISLGAKQVMPLSET
jgi:Flp pilus assembly protein TadG